MAKDPFSEREVGECRHKFTFLCFMYGSCYVTEIPMMFSFSFCAFVLEAWNPLFFEHSVGATALCDEDLKRMEDKIVDFYVLGEKW